MEEPTTSTGAESSAEFPADGGRRPLACSAVADVTEECRSYGVREVMASTQYGMGFLLVARGMPDDIGGIIWRDDNTTHAEREKIAAAVNERLSQNVEIRGAELAASTPPTRSPAFPESTG